MSLALPTLKSAAKSALPAKLNFLHTLRLWWSDWGGKLTILTVFYVCFSIIWQLTGADLKTIGWVGNIAIVVTCSMFVLTAARTLRQKHLESGLRRAWFLLMISSILSIIANAVWLYYECVLQVSAPYSWVDVLYLSVFPVQLCGLLNFPQAFRTRDEQRRFWFDAGTVLTGIGMFLWFFIIRPVTLVQQSSVYESVIASANLLILTDAKFR